MNADELVAEVIDIVDNPSYATPADILKRINRSQRRIADLLFLPDLKDGFDTVITEVGEMEVELPEDFHKNLFMANLDNGTALDIFKDVVTMRMSRSGVLDLDTGDVAAVATKKGFLVYQQVPSAATNIQLSYYRLPIDMVISDSEAEPPVEASNPDGAYGNDDFDWAIIHDTCAKIFNRIENGMEGSKVNTKKQEELLQEKLVLLDAYCDEQGKVFPLRPSTNLGWLGSK